MRSGGKVGGGKKIEAKMDLPGPMPVQVRSSSRQRLKPPRCDSISDENVPSVPEDSCFIISKRLKKDITPAPLRKVNKNVSEDETFELVLTSKPEIVSSPTLEDSFNKAKMLFHRSTPTRIIGRSMERSRIEDFWRQSVNNEDGSLKRILYICGTPGTGKTALLNEMLSGLEATSGDAIRIIQRNCMMFENASDVLFDINQEILGPQKTAHSKAVCKKKKDVVARSIVAQMKKDTIKNVLILDEVDQLALVDIDLLTTIFSWASDIDCHVSIIGIANSIDLTAKHIPLELQPLSETLYFVPYQVEDITAILTDRMRRANELTCRSESIIQPAAIELCSRKIAAIGDLRKALEIMQNAFEIASIEPDCKQVNFSHVVRALDKILPLATKSTALINSSGGNIIDQLNMNAKMILVSLVLFQDENPIPEGTRLPYKKPTLQNVYDRYVQLLKSSAGKSGALMNTVSRDEFLVLLSDLETFSIITVGKNSSSGSSRKSISSTLPDWQGSVIKLSVSDRKALVDGLKQGGITRLFM